MQTIAVFFLVSVAMGGVAWVFLYPILSGERQVEKRKASVARRNRLRAPRAGSRNRAATDRKARSRRSTSAQAKQKSRPAQHRDRAGGPVLVEAAILHHRSPAVSAHSSFCWLLTERRPARGTGDRPLPERSGCRCWLLKFLKKRREAKFLDAFPDAVDIIVRGIKAGLPLLDSLRVITTEAPEPLKSEFRAIVETQTVGMPIGEACAKLYERIPVAEANFFGIVISIQQKAGGNLSEALGNLSSVLRDRKKMKAKIQAMSMEAKASAAIIGACRPR